MWKPAAINDKMKKKKKKKDICVTVKTSLRTNFRSCSLSPFARAALAESAICFYVNRDTKLKGVESETNVGRQANRIRINTVVCCFFRVRGGS